MLRNAIVVVTGDRITAVNPATPPAGARTIDLGDVTLLPGFIDLHTHLAGEISATTLHRARDRDRRRRRLQRGEARPDDADGRLHHGARFRRRDHRGLGQARQRGDVVVAARSCRRGMRWASPAATAT